MRRLLHVLSGNWGSSSSRSGFPYRIVCPCGQTLEGFRSGKSQQVRCPSCREMHFVFPRSPLPLVESDSGGSAVARPTAGPWRKPLMAAGVTLTLVVGGLAVLFVYLKGGFNTPNPANGSHESIDEVIAQSRQLFNEGSFQTALQVLRKPIPRGERGQEVAVLLRQADLLAGLSQFSLQEIIQKGQLVRSDMEWKEQFARDYAGRAILFDDLVSREPDGRHRLVNHEILVAEERAEIRLDLSLLKQLPLNPPRRVLFGAKLSKIERLGDKTWVVEFEPLSGVLLTEESALTVLGLGPIDTQLRDLLREQEGWSRQLRE